MSLKTFEEALHGLGIEIKASHKFDIPLDLSPREDPMRSWTVDLNGQKKFMIGLGVVYDIITHEVGFRH